MTTKTTKFNTKYNQKSPYKGKTMSDVVHTVPDMHYSLQELLTRAANGMLDSVPHIHGEYFGNEVIPQFDDIQESVEYLRHKRQQLADIEAEIKAQQEAQNQPQATEKQVVADNTQPSE